MIPLFSNSLGEEELKAVERVFKSKWLAFGEECKKFEKSFAEKIGSQKVLITNNCTSALFMCMRILGIGPGDEVIVPSVNFIGIPNAILSAGAKPVFADVDERYLNILPSEIERLRNGNTKAVFILHYGGHPCNMDEIKEKCKGIYILEDSANSIVSKYKGKNCGTLGDLGCFSFDSMKTLVMGDGGAISINNPNLAEKGEQVRYFGIKGRQSGIDSLKENKARWWEIDLASPENRYVSNDILGSIANVQLEKLDSFIQKRKEIWETYQRGLKGIEGIDTPPEPLPGTESSYYFYWIRVKNNLRDKLAGFLVKEGIYCTFRYYPLHLISCYDSDQKLPNAEKANDEILDIPLHQNLSNEDVQKIIGAVKTFMSNQGEN
ncbi:MAG: DegT/DnrJ/EryC1/StrS family aminotransferase [Candidatus Nanoarchaeia archaeon]|nr:DegT/DnrJ/EryC1/StrS family aminotransferase [Candidatus Nanoarchaeia archaeon]